MSSLWELFTEDVDPQHQICITCHNCHKSFVYHKKSEQVKDHLIKCPMFAKSMMEMDEDSRPLWFNDWLSSKELESGQYSSSKLSVSQTSIKQFCLPRLKQSELKMIEDSLTMHFYIMGTSFQWVEEKHLLFAFKVARPDVELPSHKILAGHALERCYKKVQKRQYRFLIGLDAISSGWHWLGWHWWWWRPQWGWMHSDENVSPIEVDEWDTVALDRYCNIS